MGDGTCVDLVSLTLLWGGRTDRKRYPPPRARKFDGRDTDRRRSHVSLRDFNTVGVDLPPSPAVLVVRCALVDVGIVAGSRYVPVISVPNQPEGVLKRPDNIGQVVLTDDQDVSG
ncbi:hypothetical protein B0H16DRAFT_1693112 [Mycena metata]|uniref:Uncharacterized protein n=1 Tax=Mycena metata TaxID=1033252 RepID=A0AAD7DMJ3_9AGAR|nr:hypothetical protein B0H16DRAFT_1706611 [Mycena metata]KAJ7744918.1 hypothetical protein B0H16DRAFT_1693112 [Mycena metata]